ncbi:MAG: NTP transferase domain-containing protein [Tatlockia sp.]|nr:NTP transferase domain-containing protein [Tatlockia sp.]
MNIVIPMAGFGSRFAQSGFTLPKPLIKVGEKPMYRQAIDCLPLNLATNLIFILRSDENFQSLATDIRENYSHLSNLTILELDKPTEGQAETVLKSARYLKLNEPTLVHNCDTLIEEDFNWKEISKDRTIDGAIVLFNSTEPRWSFAKLDSLNTAIIDFQEKVVISNHASTGTYFFSDTNQLLKDIEQTIKQNLRQNNEFYLSTIYQLMLKNNKKIKPLWTKKMRCFGTPKDLVDSLNLMLLGTRDFE